MLATKNHFDVVQHESKACPQLSPTMAATRSSAGRLVVTCGSAEVRSRVRRHRRRATQWRHEGLAVHAVKSESS
jgi:hypothetical protein